MEKKKKTAITPTRDEDYPEWYQQVIKASDMAERSPVRGCMVIKPWGYALWENIMHVLDGMFQGNRRQKCLFPAFIPLSFLEKEAEHVEGFAKECAVVTHHRLEKARERRPGSGRGADGTPDRPADLRNHYRRFLFQMGQQLSRPAAVDQPVGQRGPLGNADPNIFANQRVSLAGRPYRPCHAKEKRSSGPG